VKGQGCGKERGAVASAAAHVQRLLSKCRQATLQISRFWRETFVNRPQFKISLFTIIPPLVWGLHIYSRQRGQMKQTVDHRGGIKQRRGKGLGKHVRFYETQTFGRFM